MLVTEEARAWVLGMICLSPLAMAQNLVVNPGFETAGSFAPW